MSYLHRNRTVIALLVFGTAFGYLEAAVVSYLRQLHEPARQRFYPSRPASELFPLLTLDQLQSLGAEPPRTLAIEIGREAATIVMLAAVALTVAGTIGRWAAAFVIVFGAWDFTFYLFLRLLLGWPTSLFTWDILFLIPVPWVGPVLAPLVVSSAMITLGVWHLRNESHAENVHMMAYHWAGLLLGAVVIVASFVMDYRNIMAGKMPLSFRWDVFAIGMLIGLGSYGAAVWQSRRGIQNVIATMRRAEAAGNVGSPRSLS
jgi:F0F1-type ATP synthase membrane subunit c/vacuolar-type H+-ATPase subunit K